ncbi:MAG TPA: EAL domain-containing protein [Solirubrobacterales bacterium]|nr:EAL domain-containing protein [Solirubrobacterales bacterium]
MRTFHQARRAPPDVLLAWGLLVGAIALYAIGLALLYRAEQPQDSLSDPANLLRLAIYPALVGAIWVFLRRADGIPRTGAIVLDAAIFSLALGAVVFEGLFNWFAPIGSVPEARASLLAFPLLDLVALVLLSLIAGPARSRSAVAYGILAASLLLLGLADVSLAVAPDAQADTGAAGAVAWTLGVLGIGIALVAGISERGPKALEGLWLYAITTVAVTTSLGLLLVESLRDREPAILVITSLVLCLALIRFALLARENGRLANDSERIIEAAGEGIYRLDLEGRLTHVNPAALRLLGYDAEDDVLGKQAHSLIHHTRPNGTPYPAAECPVFRSLRRGSTQRSRGEVYWRADGSSFPVEYTSAPIREGGRTVGAVVVFDDVSKQRQLEERVRLQAIHDSLTGLHNRSHLEREVLAQSRFARRYASTGAVLLIDLDAFELVNDALGHAAGDRVLSDVATALVEAVGPGVLVARVDGDEFGVLLRESSLEVAVETGKRLIAAIRDRVEPAIGASVGLAVLDGSGSDGDVLVDAGVALRKAKESGRGSVVVGLGGRSPQVTLVESLREAIAAGRLVVYSQPIFDLRKDEVAYEELLVRMVDASGRVVPPDSFLPTAERFGLIQQVDYFVVCEAIELAREGRAVAVNLSGRSLGDARIVARVEAAVRDGLDGRRLAFEITETSAVANMADARQFAARVRELGCTVALDDFGTGFSSFAYLKNIPAQLLKIDMDFIRELPRSEPDQHLVSAIVAVAESLGLRTVAEGVEDAETLAMVRELGIDYAQGHHLGRAQPVLTGMISYSTAARAARILADQNS